MTGSKNRHRRIYLYLTLLTAALTFFLYRYHAAQPPDEAQIERCNALADAMPENSQAEINRSINTFMDCLAE